MRAHVGDWIVVAPVHLGGQCRKGRIVRLDHRDGTLPYVVRWTGNDRETVFGPEAHLEAPGGHSARGHASDS